MISSITAPQNTGIALPQKDFFFGVQNINQIVYKTSGELFTISDTSAFRNEMVTYFYVQA
jgi:hypothetical protein